MQFTKENALWLHDHMITTRETDVSVHDFLNEIEARDMFVKPRKPGSGRKDGLTKFKIVEILRAYEVLATPMEEISEIEFKPNFSRTYLERLVNKGYLEKQTVEKTGRGRKPIKYVLTGKGRGYLALSKNWNMGE